MGDMKVTLTSSQKTSLISGILAFVLGLVYIIMTLMLPDAAVGMPNAPKVFPMGLGLLLIILGLMLCLQQYLDIKKNAGVRTAEKTKTNQAGSEAKKFVIDVHTKEIGLTVLNGILYGLMFNRIGYVLATIVFLGLELLLFNGKKKWKTVLLVSCIFSFSIYLLFNKLLGVYLPMMPFIGF